MNGDGSGKPTVVILDDDDLMITIETELLEEEGYAVTAFSSGEQALAYIKTASPDLVLSDIMMPDMDGMTFLTSIRGDAGSADTKVIMVSSKSFEFDRRQAMKLGANGFITKPIDAEPFFKTINDVMSDQMEATFWGVRGTLPVAGQKAFRYGGNTSCVTIEFPKDRFFIFDAGSGIKELSGHVLASRGGKLNAKIFISHPHWDHINALPFFVPLYIPGNEFEILGPAQPQITMREMIGAQMDDIYFPITMKEFGARVYFQDLTQGEHEVEGITVTTLLLSHPGNCLGYRVEYNGGSICYVTDNEMFSPDAPYYDPNYVKNLSAFIDGTDALITDCTYTDAEYAAGKIGWGHSSVSQVADIAHRGNVKTLYLFHHDPDQNDDAINAKLVAVEAALEALGSTTQVVAPSELDKVRV